MTNLKKESWKITIREIYKVEPNAHEMKKTVQLGPYSTMDSSDHLSPRRVILNHALSLTSLRPFLGHHSLSWNSPTGYFLKE